MKNYIVFVTTLVFLIVILTLTRVDGKISVILTPENETVFTVHEQPLLPKVNSGAEGYLVNSNPEDACTQVNPPPFAERDAVNKVGNNSVNGTNGNSSQWILIATWNNLNDSCNLLVKAKNAQKAGYSAIIIQNVLSNDSIGAISIYDWYQVNIYPCLVGSFDGKLLRENFISNEYLLRFEDDGVNTWFAYAVAGILVFLGLLLVAGLGYVVTQMLLLVLLWLGQIITTTIQQRRRNRRRRLPPSLLKRLPTQLWTDDIPQDTCSVCLENFQEGERVRVLPCSHIFHMVCIDPWLLNQRRKCPNCQGKITFPDERPSESDSSTDDEQAPLLRQSSSSSSSQTNQGAVSENEVEHERQQLQERLHAIQRILHEVAVLALVESDNDHNNRTGSSRHNSEFQTESQEPPSETALQSQRQHPNLFVESSTTPSNRGRNSLSRKVQHLVTDNALPQISEVDHEQDSLSSSLSGHGVGCYSCPEAEIDERIGISVQSSFRHPSTTNCTSNSKCQDSPEASTSVDNTGNNQDSSYTDVRVFVNQSTPMGGSSTDKNQASNQKDMI